MEMSTTASPVPRDSLGRIVYVGDRLLALGDVDLITDGKLLIGVSHGRFMVSPVRAAVDLAASPGRTNYERYFADLGTRDEVVEAADSCLYDRSISCSGCPIDGWGAAFGMSSAYCDSFSDWLYERAVI